MVKGAVWSGAVAGVGQPPTTSRSWKRARVHVISSILSYIKCNASKVYNIICSVYVTIVYNIIIQGDRQRS